MIKHRYSQIPVFVLILSLCIGSLVALPMANMVGSLNLGILEVELENDNIFDHAESEEEFTIKMNGAANDHVLSSKSQRTHLAFQDYLLASISPPPKRA